jgi:hypothetical protein
MIKVSQKCCSQDNMLLHWNHFAYEAALIKQRRLFCERVRSRNSNTPACFQSKADGWNSPANYEFDALSVVKVCSFHGGLFARYKL